MSRSAGMLLLVVALGGFLTIPGCVVAPTSEHREHRHPPPSARNGYQDEYRGQRVRYDSSLGVYVLVGRRDHYLLDGVYYRYDRDRWLYSRDLDRGWRDQGRRALPPGLARKYGRHDRDDHGHHHRDNDDHRDNHDHRR